MTTAVALLAEPLVRLSARKTHQVFVGIWRHRPPRQALRHSAAEAPSSDGTGVAVSSTILLRGPQQFLFRRVPTADTETKSPSIIALFDAQPSTRRTPMGPATENFYHWPDRPRRLGVLYEPTTVHATTARANAAASTQDSPVVSSLTGLTCTLHTTCTLPRVQLYG